MDGLNLITGFFETMPAAGVIGGVLLVLLVLGYTGAPLWLWAVAGALALAGVGAPAWLLAVYVGLALIANISPLRRVLISNNVMKLLEALNFLPSISQTERTALEAGNVWVDGELFSGKPDFKRIGKENYPQLSKAEQEFLDGPVEELCSMVDDWEVLVQKGFPQQVWDYLKQQRFFGLVIPQEYGGHEFSALAHSAIVGKIYSRCGPLGITTMVPNSLGPAELLMHYGTQTQKDYYLPRLASGEEIPSFALTEPNAGSDAGAISSGGEVFKGEDGELYLRLNWNKRYITLGAVSTVLGLAFKLRDPHDYLGKGAEPGITTALIPTGSEGVDMSRRHDPLGVPFYNCPTEGHDVIIPVDYIIGGREQAGKGWKMLMESLTVGRGISLPAITTGSAKVATRGIGAYGAIRQQFGVDIGKFEGIEEPMARIGGFTYLLEAARKFTCGGLDQGQKPAVITAMAKYNFTEMGRTIINDAMDIMGGAGISRGPRNLFANVYMATPISITVEGSNILTRSLMIFGQGAIRCHPYAYKVIDALGSKDKKAFDKTFWNHIGHVVRNMFRSVLLSITRGHLARTPGNRITRKYYRKLAWASASFGFMADLALGAYGGSLKLKEKISGRYADIFSWMYLATATIKRFEEEGAPEEDIPFFRYAMDHAFSEIQGAFEAIMKEIKVPGFTWLIHGPIALWNRINTIGNSPDDRTGHLVARAMQTFGEHRNHLTDGVYVPDDPEEALGRYEHTFELVSRAWPAARKIRKAIKRKELPKGPVVDLLEQATDKEIIDRQEAEDIRKAEAARHDAIQVDDFKLDEYKSHTPSAPAGKGSVSEGPVEVEEQ